MILKVASEGLSTPRLQLERGGSANSRQKKVARVSGDRGQIATFRHEQKKKGEGEASGQTWLLL